LRKPAPAKRPPFEAGRKPDALAQARQQGIQWIGQQVQAQASFLAYLDAFWVLMLISLAAVPLARSCAGSSWAPPPPRATKSLSRVSDENGLGLFIVKRAARPGRGCQPDRAAGICPW
jgi:hypothetical protein